MIAYLKGQILEKTSKSTILLVGEIGYEVFLSIKNLEKIGLGEAVEFYIYSNIKEDAFDLYGFKTLKELDFFKKLLSVSGVGPKSAINILSLAEVDDLKRAITSGDPSFLQQVSGIGKKTAERLVVELKEKFINDLSEVMPMMDSDKQVMEALMSLGYKASEIKDVTKDLDQNEKDLATRIKAALRLMHK